MVVEFNRAHEVAHGDYDAASPYSNLWRKNLVFSQLAVCITGTPEYILEKLKKMVSEMEGEDGKPTQGQLVTNNCFTIEVITPVWDGEILKSMEEMLPKP